MPNRVSLWSGQARIAARYRGGRCHFENVEGAHQRPGSAGSNLDAETQQSHKRRLRAIQRHVINVRVRQKASILRVIVGKRDEAIGSQQGTGQVVPTSEAAFAPVQAHHASAWRPLSGPVNDGAGRRD
jgi:hypothetical protein